MLNCVVQKKKKVYIDIKRLKWSVMARVFKDSLRWPFDVFSEHFTIQGINAHTFVG